MPIQLGRDPFARRTIRRVRIYSSVAGCRECGSVKTDSRTGFRFLFRYIIEDDRVSYNPSTAIPGEFCGIGCLNQYHG
jgi:hypothetical protein